MANLSEQDAIEIAKAIMTSAEALRHSRAFFFRSPPDETKLLCVVTALVRFFDAGIQARVEAELNSRNPNR